MTTIPSIALALTLLLAAVVAEKPSCGDLGFTGLQTCADCEVLSQYVSDQELVDDCKSCCAAAPVAEPGLGKFRSGTLEVCKHRLREFPTVETFVNEKAEAFENLEVVYRFGSFPRLLLRGEAGRKETLRIDKWKTEAIEEFLRDKLAASAATL